MLRQYTAPPSVDLSPIDDLTIEVAHLREALAPLPEKIDAMRLDIATRIDAIHIPQPVMPSPRDDTMKVVVSSFAALGYALSARALLLIALLGTFVVAVLALERGDMASIATLALFGLSTVVPVTVLEIRKTRQ